MFGFSYSYEWLAFVILRTVIGLFFLAHGWQKLGDLKKNAANFSAMGFRPGVFWGTLVVVAEFFGGLAFIFGFAANCAALILSIQFVVIMFWRIFRRDRFIGGYEYDLIILALLLFFAANGF